MGWKDKARERAKEKRQGRTFKLGEGENYFRILPNKKGLDKAPYVEFMVHRDVGPEKSFVRCGKRMDGRGSCWLCDVRIPALKKSGSRSASKQAEKLVPKEQFMVQACHVDPKTGKYTKPKPWWVSTGGAKSMSTQLLSLLASSKRNYEDPKRGYCLTVERTGTGMETRYGPLQPDEEPSRVPKEILPLLKPLEELVPEYSKDEQEAVYLGKEPKQMGKKKRKREDEDEDLELEDDEEEEEADEDEESDEEEEDDEDEESDDEDDDEEEEKPSKKKSKKSKTKAKPKKSKKSKKSKSDDDDDEDEDEDDEDEEEDSDDEDDEEEESDDDEESDDEDEEEEDDEDDEEEEPPAKSKRSKSKSKPASKKPRKRRK